MARTKEGKIVSKKKVNKYTVAECKTAIDKLTSNGHNNSRHFYLIEDRLKTLTA